MSEPDWVEPRIIDECPRCGCQMTHDAAVQVCERWFLWMDKDEIPVDWVACPRCVNA